MRNVQSFEDIQVVINQILTKIDSLPGASDFKKNKVTGIPDPVSPTDAINLQYLKTYIASQLEALNITATPTNASKSDNLIIVVTLNPKSDNKATFGSALLRWAKGYFVNLFCTSLAATGNVGAATITSNSTIIATGIGTFGNVVTGGTVVATGNVTGANIPASIAAKSAVGTFITGAKLTLGGINGSVTINADGTLTFTAAT